MAARYLVPALAVAGRVAAQCSVSGTTTIQNGGDATALASCTTFSGSIALATGVTGSIALDGIEEITGSLVAMNVSQLTALTGDSLKTIDDAFTLDTVQALASLVFPDLTSVGSITWNALPHLMELTFQSEITMAQSVDIENTALASLTGLNLETIDTLTLTNNPFLDDITMQLGNVSTMLLVSANGPDTAASFPNLIWADGMNLQNLISINIPSLAAINGTLTFEYNFFTNLSAPNLTTVGSDLNIIANGNMSSLSMPMLTSVTNALVIANNSDLSTITGFPMLSNIGGTFTADGAFTYVELPSITNVGGAFDLLSTESNITGSCSVFSGESGRSNKIKVLNECKSDASALSTGANATTASGSGAAASSSPTKGAANAVVITGATGLLGVVAAIFGML